LSRSGRSRAREVPSPPGGLTDTSAAQSALREGRIRCCYRQPAAPQPACDPEVRRPTTTSADQILINRLGTMAEPFPGLCLVAVRVLGDGGGRVPGPGMGIAGQFRRPLYQLLRHMAVVACQRPPRGRCPGCTPTVPSQRRPTLRRGQASGKASGSWACPCLPRPTSPPPQRDGQRERAHSRRSGASLARPDWLFQVRRAVCSECRHAIWLLLWGRSSGSQGPSPLTGVRPLA
jgi:hypothetical protein